MGEAAALMKIRGKPFPQIEEAKRKKQDYFMLQLLLVQPEEEMAL